MLGAVVQEVTPAGALVRDWDRPASSTSLRRPRFRSASKSQDTGDDYLSSIHPNAVDLKANGPGTADDQLIVSARHADAVYGINFDTETVDWKLGGTPHLNR